MNRTKMTGVLEQESCGLFETFHGVSQFNCNSFKTLKRKIFILFVDVKIVMIRRTLLVGTL